jgi:HAD superfamily hydrolase (TIGR01549 family)
MRTVLVVSGGGLQGMALIEALRRIPQTRTVLMDCHEDNIGRYHATRFVRAPLLTDEDAFLDCLLGTCRDEGIDFVFPATERELDMLARARSRIESLGARLMVSQPPALEVGMDKLRLHTWLSAHGLPSLRTVIDPVAAGLPLPWLGKPRSGWGGQGAVVARTLDAWVEASRGGVVDRVWQPLIEGFDEYSVDFAIDGEGRVSPLAVRRRIRTLSGFALICEPVEDLDVHALAARVADALAALGGCGVLNLQILRTTDGLWVSDLNPRVGTSLPLSLAVGRNPVAFLLGQPEPVAPPHQTVRTFRALHERAVAALDLTQVRGLVFDLDDTLFDQKDWIGRKLQAVWQRHQDELPPRQRYLRDMHWLLEEGHRSDLIDAYCALAGLGTELGERLIASYRAAQPDACRLYDDAWPVLSELRRRGYRLALLTDNPTASQRMKVHVARLASAFDAIVYTGDLGASKPDRRGFDAVADGLGLAPDRLVMVGDNLYRDSVGSLDAGFAHAFLVRHAGSMFDFGTGAAWSDPAPGQLTSVLALTELLWYLEGPKFEH